MDRESGSFLRDTAIAATVIISVVMVFRFAWALFKASIIVMYRLLVLLLKGTSHLLTSIQTRANRVTFDR